MKSTDSPHLRQEPRVGDMVGLVAIRSDVGKDKLFPDSSFAQTK